MAASGSTKVVVAALVCNGFIAVLKFAAASWTGSAAMLSEAIHSVADTANQALLLLGLKRARRGADVRHPFGYSKEIYFWSFVVAILLFSLGAGVSLYEGVAKLRHPHPITDPIVNYVVLGLAIVFEIGSTTVAVREFNARREGRGVLMALRSSKDPALFTVLLEDLAALAGLIIALAGVMSAHLLALEAADGVASIAIGLVLALVAAFMSIETKSLLIGEAANPDIVAGIDSLLRSEIGTTGPVTAIKDLKTMHLGPDDLLVAANLDFRDGETAKGVEATIARLERVIRQRYPQVRNLFLEAGTAAHSAYAPMHAGEADIDPTSLTMADLEPAVPIRVAAPARKAYPPPKRGKGKKRRR